MHTIYYFKQDYDFSEEKLLSYIKKSIEKFGLTQVSAEEYFQDLKKVVCLLIKDGEEYKFAHRSFQAYFSACYTAEALDDQQQKKLLRTFVRRGNWRNNLDYLDILDQLQHERMIVNLLEEPIRLYLNKAQEDENPARSYAKMVSPNAIMVRGSGRRRKKVASNHVVGYYIIPDSNGIDFNWYEGLFNRFVLKDNKLFASTCNRFPLLEIDWPMLDKIDLQENQQVDVGLWAFTPFGVLADFIEDHSFIGLDEFGITEADMNRIYENFATEIGTAETLKKMSNWLDSLENKRKKLEEKSFIDDL